MKNVSVAVASGLVYALACAPSSIAHRLYFAATITGLQRSMDGGRSWADALAKLTLQAPLTATSVAFSPDFGEDCTLFVGAPGGVLRSQDAGENWRIATLPTPPPFVTCLAVSPNYRADGLVFAGAMEDGVLRSWDRGESWAAWNFGLLDLNVFALAVSPNFTEDDTLFVGVESGVFRSANGGRAWRETAFPMDAAPVLSLAISHDKTVILAGTEQNGLWSSRDQGESWQPVASWLERTAINTLHIEKCTNGGLALLALTGAAVWCSYDSGASWQKAEPNAGAALTCVAAPDGIHAGAELLLGTEDGHIWIVRAP